MVRTSNKKYFKRFDIPDMKRLKLPLEESAVAWKYQHNTLIIGYDKPEKITELEKKKIAEITTSQSKQGIPAIPGITTNAPQG